MKWILCVTVFTLLVVRTRQSSDKYDLLPLEHMDEYGKPAILDDDADLGPNDFCLNFTGIHTKIPIKKLDISGKTISSPYLIHMVFKLSKAVSSSMFSIEDGKNIRMMLQFAPAGSTTTRMTLSVLNTAEISFQVEDMINDWSDIIIHVQDENVVLYNTCTQIADIAVSGKKKVEFTKDAFLVLGNTKIYPTLDVFNGFISKIDLYTNADNSTQKTICRDASKLLDTLLQDYSSEENYSDEIEPENIEDRGDGGWDIDRTFTTIEPRKAEKGERGDKGDQGDRGFKGIKGEKGEKGEFGLKGEPGESVKGEIGIQGPPGLDGIPGKRGEEGKCSCSESVVSSLLTRMPEMKGPRGEPGPQGVDGPRGLTGLTGEPGPPGERGLQGPDGEMGESGEDGAPGKDGAPGLKGEPGKDGIPGSPGAQGVPGPPGPPGKGYVETEADKRARAVMIPGERGPEGPQGPPGLAGLKGEPGEKGATGDKGDRGEKGDKGHKGHEGSRGVQGDRGEAGKDGMPGIPGNHGRDGQRGEKGEMGDKGSPGMAGIPASITELLNPDMDPTENTQIVEKLRGFKGDKGMAGVKGIKGDLGLPGIPGMRGEDGLDGEKGSLGPQGPKGDLGPIGSRGHKGDQGEPGPPGLVPASHIALMKGTKGDRGVPGLRGNRGPPGYNGKTGSTGKPGSKGAKGDIGPPGPMGPLGPPGLNGTIGEKGQKGECAVPTNFTKLRGDKGDRGEPGAPGYDGKPGPQGPAGVCSECNQVPVIGAPGPPGPPGPPGLSISGPKGEPGGIVSQNSIFSFDFDGFDSDDDFHVTATVMFRTTKALLKRTSETPLGTLAYVLQENILLIRVERGWQYVKMEGLLTRDPREAASTPTPPPSPKPYYDISSEPSLMPYHRTSTEPSPRPYHHSSTESSPKPYHHTSTERPYHVTQSNPSLNPYRIKPSAPTRPRPNHIHRSNTYLRLAALNDPSTGRVYSPRRIGHSAADYLCNQQSLEYGGNFRAFLTNRVLNAMSIVTRRERRLPVRNLHGDLLFDSWDSMFNGSEAKFNDNPVNIYSFNMRNVMIDSHWPNKVAWHGSDPRGVRQPGSFCNEWESQSHSDYGAAASLNSGRLLSQEFFSCDNKLIVLCVEVSAAEPRRKRHSFKRNHVDHHAYEDNFIGV